MRIIATGTRGDDVRDVQARLAGLGFLIGPDEPGVFGPATERAVREFQQRRHLLVDGVVGSDTWEELVEAGFALGDRLLYLRYPYNRGDDVRALQRRLNILGFDAGREDGIFGEGTDRAVRDFQRNVGMADDGIVGRTTVDALLRLRPVAPGPGRSTVREAEALRTLASPLRGSRVAVDAGHGSDDAGGVGAGGLKEAEAVYLLAETVSSELSSRGAEPLLLRRADTNPTQSERARAANQGAATLLLSIHLNGHADPRARGASAFYYGTETWFSQAGQRLADVVVEELTSRLGLPDLRCHRAAVPLLRETRMPAIQIEPCFITNPLDEALLRDEGFRKDIARAVVDAVERFLGPGEIASSAAETATRQ
jgi:N-acetylmuramoyl-L-alanine amidase